MLQAALSAWPQSEEQQEAQLATLPSERARNVLLRLRGTCAGWRLVLTGHSLGGGVTGLLGPLLQSKYPNLRWALWVEGPPGPLENESAHGVHFSGVSGRNSLYLCCWRGRGRVRLAVGHRAVRFAGGGRGG